MSNTPSSIPIVKIYSDGGADPNPGKGGFGVVLLYQGHRKEFSQGYLLTSNNRMELMGVIFGLRQLKKPCIVDVYTDSQYVVQAIEKGWAAKWRANHWYQAKYKKTVNSDLWERLLDLIEEHVSVKFHWIKGHAGNIENERCDELATLALNGENLIEDEGYLSNKLLEEDESYSNQKITKVGDLCRKCFTPVVKRIPANKKPKNHQSYYFEYYLFCPKCKTIYMIESAKVHQKPSSDKDLFS